MILIQANENAFAPVAELHLRNGEDVHIIGPQGDEIVVYIGDNGELEVQA